LAEPGPTAAINGLSVVKNQARPAPVFIDVHNSTVRPDVDDLETVYREHGARLWRAIYLYSGDRDIASDALSEAFAQALRRGDAIRSPERWIWRAAFRIAAGELAHQRQRSSDLPDLSYELPVETAELLDALRMLPLRQRAAIILHYFGDYSLRETARIVASTPSAVGVQLYRGRKRLRGLLEEDDG
jgi:RNA polymerase sigma-70 factor, ECF subfamily